MSEGLAAVQSRVAELRSMLGLVPAPSVALGSGSSTASGQDFASTLAQALTGSDLDTSTATSAAATARGDVGARAVALAAQLSGTPYVWGGEDPATGVDCSGLVQYVYGKLGVQLPRVAADQSRVGTPVASLDDARPGDLVFYGSPADHVGIYLGDGKMIDAPRRGKTVGVHDLWGQAPSAIRRVSGLAATATTAALPSGGSTGLPSDSSAYAALFAAAGARYGVDPALLSAVAKTESAYNPRAVSSAGAQGLMQLMPATAKSLGVNAFDPAQAVDGAARLLKGLLQDFGSVNLALAAYNAGPGAVRKYGGIPPYSETQNYVKRVNSALEALR